MTEQEKHENFAAIVMYAKAILSLCDQSGEWRFSDDAIYVARNADRIAELARRMAPGKEAA